jgi:hypothetical protein
MKLLIMQPSPASTHTIIKRVPIMETRQKYAINISYSFDVIQKWRVPSWSYSHFLWSIFANFYTVQKQQTHTNRSTASNIHGKHHVTYGNQQITLHLTNINSILQYMCYSRLLLIFAISWRQSCRVVKLTTYLHLVWRLRMLGVELYLFFPHKTEHHAMKAYWRTGSIAPHILWPRH